MQKVPKVHKDSFIESPATRDMGSKQYQDNLRLLQLFYLLTKMLTVSIEIKSTVNCKVALITEKQHCRLTLWKCDIDTGEIPIKTKVSEQKIPKLILKRRLR